MKNEGLEMGFCVQYESFSFDLIISDLPIENSKSEFLESKNFVPITINLDQTLDLLSKQILGGYSLGEILHLT